MFNRVQTVGTVSDFTTGIYKVKKVERKVNKKLIKYGVRVAVTIIGGSLLLDLTMPMATPVMAQEAVPAAVDVEKIQSTIIKAFEPLIKVIISLSYPIAGVMLSWGALRFMLNQKEEAIRTIQNTALGYIIVQMSPLFLKLLVSIGGAVV